MYDITRSVSPQTAVWPGDQPFEVQWTAELSASSVVNIGAVRMSTHCGTHADAPLHFQAGGGSIDTIPLTVFIGPARVVQVPATSFIRPEDVPDVDLRETPRVLFRTRSSEVKDTAWTDRFPALHPDTAHWLGQRGVLLVGTDAPSVDPAASKALPAHKALHAAGITILENLSLRAVLPGRYRLVALPLKLIGMDAAPVRAVLFAE
jgi:arylformamidase